MIIIVTRLLPKLDLCESSLAIFHYSFSPLARGLRPQVEDPYYLVKLLSSSGMKTKLIDTW